MKDYVVSVGVRCEARDERRGCKIKKERDSSDVSKDVFSEGYKCVSSMSEVSFSVDTRSWRLC